MSLYVEITTAETFDQHLPAYRSFLRTITAENQNSQVLINMGDEGPSGLLYLIRPEREQYRRWTLGNGEIALLYDRLTGSIVGVSAVEHSPLGNNLSSGGNRCWLRRDFRSNNEVSRFLLTSNLEWSKKTRKQGMMLTFNDHNKGIYDAIVNRTQGRGKSIANVWSNWWNDCLPVTDKIVLHGVAQWAVIKPTGDSEVLKNTIDRLLLQYREIQ
jgi:hypothetical protein